MRLLIDENVPDAVADVFRARGHEVILVRDIFLPGTEDLAVAAMGDQLEAIVVTWDKDFKLIVKRAPHGTRACFLKLGRISFNRCRAPKGAQRLEAVFDAIEFEYAQAQQRADKRAMIEIGDNYVRFWR